MWAAEIVTKLMEILPEDYSAGPNFYPGTIYEVDVGTFRQWMDDDATLENVESDEETATGGPAVAIGKYAPPKPTVTLEPLMPDQDIYEVRIYDVRNKRQLVAVIELISPSNKDRPENRMSFLTKIANLLHLGISVTIVDVVTTRRSNLYGELLNFFESDDPALGKESAPIYAVTLRTRFKDRSQMLEERRKLLDAWYHPLEIGQELPTLPVWLKGSLAIPLELESSYEETCRTLRIR